MLSLQRLRQFRVNVREFTDANDDANKFKNRLANALPCELYIAVIATVCVFGCCEECYYNADPYIPH